MTAKKLTAALAAAAIVVALSACGTGGGGAADEEVATPLTLDDLKPTPDDFFPGFGAPNDLEVPEQYESIARSLGSSLSSILEASFEDPSTWSLTSDEEAISAVAAGYSAVGEANSATFADALLSEARGDAAEDERLATRYASTFAPATQPTDMFVYKLKWDASVDEESATVTVAAVVWAGYEVDGRVVISARQFEVNGMDQGPNIGYSIDQPAHGGFYDLCASVVDGVLAPSEDEISAVGQKSLKAEFADLKFRPLYDTFLGKDDDDAAPKDRPQRVEDCLSAS